MKFTLNKIISYLLMGSTLTYLLSCETNDSSNPNEVENRGKVVSDNSSIITLFERNGEHDVSSNIKINKGFIVWGLEVTPLAKGLIPYSFVEAKGDNLTMCSFNFNYKVFENKQFELDGEIELYKEKVSKGYYNGSRRKLRSLGPLKYHPEVIESFSDNVYRLEYGEMKEDRTEMLPLTYKIVLYFSESLDDLKKKVTISLSVPMWNWRPSQLQIR